MQRTTFIRSVLTFAVAALACGVQAQDIKERTFKFGVTGPESHPAGAGMRKFAELVEQKSGGRIKVKLFWNSALGSDQAVVSALMGGTVEMTVINSGILGAYVKDLSVFDFPFLFASEKESDAIVDGPIGQRMHKLLEERGAIGLAFWELGYREITNSKRPITKVEDIAGLKLRVIPNPINIDWVKALGANPTPMPFPEVYGAMESKAIDGHENPVSVIAANRFWEVQKYVALTHHQYNPQSVIFSRKVWETLSATEKKIVTDSAHDATQVQRQQARAAVAANLDLLRKNGMTVTQLPPSEVARLRELMKPVIAKHASVVGEPLVNEITAELAKMRK